MERNDFIELPKDIIPIILQGDVIKSLQKIPDNSISVVVTSPPYWNLRDYEIGEQIGQEETPDEYISKMAEITKELRRRYLIWKK